MEAVAGAAIPAYRTKVQLSCEVGLVIFEPMLKQQAYAVNRPALLAPMTKPRPSVVILDPNGSFSRCVGAGWELRRSLAQANAIVLTMSEDCKVVADALRWYSVAAHAAPKLIKAICEVLEGNSHTTPNQSPHRFIQNPHLHATSRLTPRQGEVLRLLAEGRPMKDIAITLKVATRTVAFHKYQIMGKFGLESNIDLVRLAIRERLIEAN
jgi:DNA-binding NarL/FixJ family response regulator